MSRTRIVKGKYTKIIEGNYNVSAEGTINYNALKEVRDNGVENGVFYGNFNRIGSNVSDDFDVRFSLKKDKSYSTFVPFGILDYSGTYENPYFVFNYSLMLSNIDTLEFKILNEDGTTLYAITNLPEIVVTVAKEPSLKNDIVDKKPINDPLNRVLTWDWRTIFNTYSTASNDYTKIGSYVIFWDGFDNNGIYDSTMFHNKKLKAVIVATKNGVAKTKEVEFTTNYKEVNWVDVKIDKNNKKIDTILRVNLKDGGANGLKCETYITGVRINPHWETKCPWDEIPKKDLIPGKPPITTQTKSFADLEKLALDGLNYHWGRNKNHSVAKDVKINGESYEVYIDAVNTEENSMDDVDLVYNTNGSWMRSGNPGTATGNPISWVGNLISREAICYNVGYIEYSNDWGYNYHENENIDFSFTSAHEVGHEILKSYGGTIYSYGHKGSVNTVTQNKKDNTPDIDLKSSEEIDIMPYYESSNKLSYTQFKRYAAAEKDVLSLIWLTKINIL